MKKNHFATLVLALASCCTLYAQSIFYDPSRVYDTVTDADSFYLFFTPKPCIEPELQGGLPGNVMLEEYIISDTVTVYGVALTMRNAFSQFEINYNTTPIQAMLMVQGGLPYDNRHYSMQIVDTVSLIRSHPRFCWFQYKNNNSCSNKDTLNAPCYELYFDTPFQINRMTDTFYVGMERFSSDYFIPRYYCGRYDNSLQGHLFYAPGSTDSLMGGYNYFERGEWYSNKLWGIAFPIIGFRCKPIPWYRLESYIVGSRTLVWANAEEGTIYNVRLMGEDGSDTTFVTNDTVFVLPPVSDSVRYTVKLRKQCHYATTNYDTTVYSDWLSYISFGTTILPPDTADRDTVWWSVAGISGNPERGIVYGSGVYMDSSMVDLTASPFSGCEFDAWSDGNTFNPRAVFVVSDTTLVALFRGEPDSVGIQQPETEDFLVHPNPASGTVRIVLPSEGGCLVLCDLNGRELEQRIVTGTTVEWDISSLPEGSYLLRIHTPQGTATKKLTVRR